MKISVICAIALTLLMVGVIPAEASGPRCGNGIVEGIEECDNGSNNSDIAPNTCRTKCRLPRCGDGVVDDGEECDQGSLTENEFSNTIPNACRTKCRLPRCGDGVVDSGEECDDGNANQSDGCHLCKRCFVPKDDLRFIMADHDLSKPIEPGAIHVDRGSRIELCEGVKIIQDDGMAGIIIIEGDGVTLECRGTRLIGTGGDSQQAEPLMGTVLPHGTDVQSLRTAPQTAQQTTPAKTKFQGIVGFVKRFMSRSDGVESAEESPAAEDIGMGSPQVEAAYAGGDSAQLMQPGEPHGTAIVVMGNDNVIRGCAISNFVKGVQIDANYTGNVLIENTICGNTNDIVTSDDTANYGAKNKCQSVTNWSENCNEGCSSVCTSQ